MFIEVKVEKGTSERQYETINLELVKSFKRAYVGQQSAENGNFGTAFYFVDKTQIISIEDYDTIKKRIKREAQKQTSVISRFELMEID